MLIDDVVQFCDKMYSSFKENCGCDNGHCNHPSGECSGSCYNCLYQIHFPERAPENSKTEYDCVKMLYHYVCQYSHLYTREILCAFENEWSFIKDFPYFHILSLGCGGCADLMAFDILRQKKRLVTTTSYMGIDKNELWSPIHLCIRDCCKKSDIRYQTYYYDVFELFKGKNVLNPNIVIISYLISYLYNTNQITAINDLAEALAKRAIKKKSMPLLLIINDVNSYKRGRNYFSYFENAIQKNGLTVAKSEYKYFDTGSLYDGQRLGSPYNVNQIVLSAPKEIREKYHAATSINSTVQLLVEVS